MKKAKIITMCGSTKFKEHFRIAERDLASKGYVILMPHIFSHAEHYMLSDDEIIMFNNIHKQEIEMSDFIYVVNPNDYIGNSTQEEIKYAKSLSKDIFYMYPSDGNPTI